MFTLKRKSLSMPTPAEALPGRAEAIPTAANHFVNGAPLSAVLICRARSVRASAPRLS